MKLYDLGFDQWFETHVAPLNENNESNLEIARVTAVDRGSYLIRNELREAPAELAGKLSYQIENSVDLPCVGDWIAAQYHNDGATAIIHRVYPRKSFLRRKTAGENVDIQMIASNLDAAFIIQSCHFDFNPRRMDRYLVMASDGHVEPIILLTKTDLISPRELEEKIAILHSTTRAPVLSLSNVTGVGFDEFLATLSPGKTFCLLGSSGVGKTTLINRLIGRDVYDTKTVSHTGEGTHTTSRRQLIVLSQGAMLVDTPGMRELGLVGANEGMNLGFENLVGLSTRCRYSDCTHQHEPGCAVRAAVENGDLNEDRYSNYLKLKKESDYHEMSYLDKRKKDKAFGRMVKSVKKHRNY